VPLLPRSSMSGSRHPCLASNAHGDYPKGSWIRYPDGSEHEVTSGPDGALLYVKVGHLSASSE